MPSSNRPTRATRTVTRARSVSRNRNGSVSLWPSPFGEKSVRCDVTSMTGSAARAGSPGNRPGRGPHRELVCRATCYRLTGNVAFTRAVAFHDAEADPIATWMGTFMIGTKPGFPRKGDAA